MSRYSKRIENRVYAFGYDRPLQEYFFQRSNVDRVDDVVFSISSHATIQEHPEHLDRLDWSNSQIADLVVKEMGPEAPKEFLTALALDIPF